MTATVLLDTTAVLDLLAEVVADMGEDYVYPDELREGGVEGACYYVVNGQPACIIGHVLARAGLLDHPVAVGNWNAMRLGVAGLDVDTAPPVTTVDAARVLAAAQSTQDDGDTWGEALRCAQERAAEVTE